jgi:DNA-binding CsgD family transcriptional regulator
MAGFTLDLVKSYIERCPVLTEREKQCLALAAEGKANKEIARDLGIVERTVKTHLREVRGKLGAVNRTHSVSVVVSLMGDRHYNRRKDLRSLLKADPKTPTILRR